MNTFSNDRLERLQKELKISGVDGCLVEDPLDLFYLTNLKLSVGKLLISPHATLLLVDSRYLQVAQEKAPCPVLLDSPEEWISFCRQHEIRRLGFDARHTSYERFLSLQKNKNVELVPSAALFKKLRLIKDPSEIAKMRTSAKLLWKGFEFIQSSLKVGVTEKEISKKFEIFCLEHGGEGLSFEPIIAFGASSAMPHYRSQNVPLTADQIVLVDIGVKVDGYHSDMTRCLFFGKEDPYLSRLYEITQKAQRSALAECRPGQTVKQIDLAARHVYKKEGVEELFVHSLGHGIGLEVHEYPRIKFDTEDKDLVLEEGMVFTVEPGLYVPGVGGVRYEDTIVITSDGYENFYPF